MSSQHRFGYEWDRYAAMTPEYEAQFRNWTYPLAPSDWRGKRVLDAGCGMGRNSYWPLKWGAAAVTAFDYDQRSVARANTTLKEFESVAVLYKSIYDIDWNNEFDTAFSIGVIHHLADPKRALSKLVESLKPGGLLLVWVYSYEGNEWIVRFVDPVRKHVTSKLPLPLVHALAYGCSVPLFVFAKLFRKTPYLKQLSYYHFWHVHSIVFDQLIPDIANYWRKEEVRDLVAGLPVSNVTVEMPPNNMGWILRATRK